MSKTSLLYLVPVCLLSACGGGGGGDKEKINVTDASSAFQASPLVNTEHTFDNGDLDFIQDLNAAGADLISLSGAGLSLKFTSDGVKQVAQLSGSSQEMENTWASVEFAASDFVWNEDPTDVDYKIVRASATNTFDMNSNVAQGQRYRGTAVSNMALGGQAVGLAYSDFGYLNIDVTGNLSFYNGASEAVNFSYFEAFTQGNSSYAVGSDAVQSVLAAAGGGNSRMVFTGKAFARMSGSLVLPKLEPGVKVKGADGNPLKDDAGEETGETVDVVNTTDVKATSPGNSPFVGDATLSVGTSSADLMLDFSDVGLGTLNFASSDGSTWNLWYPNTSQTPSQLQEDQKYVNDTVSGAVSDREGAASISITGKAELDYNLFGDGTPQEGVGSFNYTQTTTITPAEGEAQESTSLISGVFGVANPTVETPTSSAP